MKKFLFITCFLLASCANPHLQEAPDITLPAPTVSHNIRIEFKNCRYRSWLKNRIAAELDRFPEIHDWLEKVIITNVSREGVLGYCDWYTHEITLDDRSWKAIKNTLWHEIGHALQKTSLTDKQLYEWCEIAAKRMDTAGLKDWTKKKWESRVLYHGFPTPYSTKNIWEYMSEHFEYFMKNRDGHKDMYPEEHALIIKCGWAPSK